MPILFCLWLFWASLSPTLPKRGEPPRLYANPSRENLRITIREAIQGCHSSIYLSIFGLNDPPILSALAQKAKTQIPTTIFYDPNGSPEVRKYLPSSVLHPVWQSGLMHEKILILDDELVFLGSANFTTQSLKMHDNLVIGFVSAPIAQFLKERKPHTPGYFRSIVGGQTLELWMLPDPKGHALADLRKHIRRAGKTIRVAIFTLTHMGLVDELIRAHERGVDVTVTIDLHSSLGASAQAAKALEEGGVCVLYSQGVQLLHHKFVCIDEMTLITGSANWTKSAFTKNSDCFTILHSLNSEQRRFMERLWRQIITNTTHH